ASWGTWRCGAARLRGRGACAHHRITLDSSLIPIAASTSATRGIYVADEGVPQSGEHRERDRMHDVGRHEPRRRPSNPSGEALEDTPHTLLGRKIDCAKVDLGRLGRLVRAVDAGEVLERAAA